MLTKPSDEVSQITSVELTSEFFSQFSALSTCRNLNSVLNKALASDNEAFNDPLYRTEMVSTFQNVAEFITRLAAASGNNVLKE